MARQALLKVTAWGIFRYFTRHRTAANLLLVLMLAAGLMALPRMHAQFFPDVVIGQHHRRGLLARRRGRGCGCRASSSCWSPR
jgi:hypothetical protein